MWNKQAHIYIPKEKISPEFLRLMGFSEKEISNFYESINRTTVDTRIHDIEGIEFDEYETIE